VNPPPPTWPVVLAGFCAFLDLYATQPILPLLGAEFHVSKASISLTVTLATLGVALSAPLIGTLADRAGRKRMIVLAAALLAVTTALAAGAGGLGSLLVWRFLQGVVTPGIFAVTVAYIQEEWALGGAGAATAAYVTGTVLGGFSGRAVTGWVATHAGWRVSFLTLGVMNALGAVALACWLPRERAVHAGKAARQGWAALPLHLRNRPLVATCAAGFCVLFSMHALFTYVPFHLAAPPFGLGPGALGSIFGVYLIGAVITPWFGKRIDHLGHRSVFSLAAGIGVSGALLTLVPNLWAVIAGLALACTGVFIEQSAASSHIGKAAQSDIALAVGLYVTLYYAGGSAGAAVPGWFWSLAGWTGCVLLVAAVQATTAGIAWRFWGDQPLARLSSSVSAGTTSNKSPTMP
jgi:YNFM family putative membrane transporter